MDTPLIAVTGRRRSAAGLHSGPPAMDALEIDAYFTGTTSTPRRSSAAARRRVTRCTPVLKGWVTVRPTQ